MIQLFLRTKMATLKRMRRLHLRLCSRIAVSYTITIIQYNLIITASYLTATDDVMVQWGSLVDKFRRTRKDMLQEGPSGTSGEEVFAEQPKWDLYERISYLSRYIKQRE